MKRNFIEEFKARIKKLDEADLPKKQIEPKTNEVPKHLRLYNIHKRSLPVGIDKIVVFNITKQDAEWWIETKLKTRCYENGADDSKTLIYYDVIPTDATPKEKNVFYNMSPVTTEPVPGLYTPKRIN